MPSEMPDTEYDAQMLRTGNPLIEPVDRAAIQALQLPPGSRGLDAGCGIGLQAVLLAEAVGPAGHVTGLELSDRLPTAAGADGANRGTGSSIITPHSTEKGKGGD